MTAVTTVLMGTCQWCGSTQELHVKFNDWRAWEDGALIQNCFPYLSADQRELLISNTCGKCWDSMFDYEE